VQPAVAPQPAATDAAPAPAGAAVPAIATTLAVPVTKLDPARPALPPPPAPAAPLRVQPDPLTPRVAGSGVLPTSPGSRPAKRVPLTYKPPSSAGHPTAGYARSEPYVARTLAPTVPTVVTTEPVVQSRDLEPVATPGPAYPPEAFRARVEGWVEVEFTVTERGTTRDVEVVGAQPRGVFDAAAIAAVAGWTYRPRVVNGAAVAQRSSVTLRFNVED
jgi:protein TonB